MRLVTSLPGVLRELGQGAWRWLGGWWRIVRFAAEVLVLALSPSSYRAEHRDVLVSHLYLATAPSLAWFSVLSALVSLVLIRIVIVTAQSYDLSHYALEMVVRVLVLELLPLFAALFVALRYSIPRGSELYKLRTRGGFDALRARGQDPLRQELVPSVVAGVFAVLALASVSGMLALALAYLSVYGFTPWGFAGYTRTVGHVFNAPVALILGLKTLFFGLAVSVIPIATSQQDLLRSRTSVELQGLVRMLSLVLLVEVASLVGNYY
ncbi:ABC transporter permease [Ramlibacter sp. 2FC]|uniref:MlaE family ABC transporter permease n=1 Tax=Ramlibacter sp. 2FC TaxID=2502188 RepID=UPI0010F63694|nr:ABC transporter permease [Ramlibacter sp. 2FC]